MDYFSELLESYNKLKKRTFKLVYLTENTGAADAAIIQILGTAPQGGYVPMPTDQYPGLSKFKYRLAGDGSKGVMYGQRQANILTKDGQKITSNETAQDIWDALYAALSGKDPETTPKEKADQSAEELKRQQEAQRLSKLALPGGAFEEMGFDLEKIGPGLDAIDATIKTVQDYCANFDDKTKPKYCRETGRYLTGIDKAGFAHKLAYGKALEVDPETGKKIDPGKIQDGLINQVAQSNKELMDFIAGKGDCATITDKVGFYKDRLVLFGGERSEGITIKPNDLQKDAISAVERDCPDAELSEIITDTLNGNAVNAVKGTFNELVLQLGVRLLAAETDEERKESFSDVAKEINKKREFLRKYAEQQATADDVALGLDDTFEQSVLLEQAGIAEDTAELKAWFLKELSFQMAFIRMMDADGVESSGKDVKTGGRDDTILTYKDEAKAKEKAKIVGAKVIKAKDGNFKVLVGQKRLSKLKDTKLGEINSMARMIAIATGKAKDKNVQEGFLKTISEMQFGGDKQRDQEAIQYIVDMESRIQKAAESLTKTKTYKDSKGRPRLSTPEQKLKLIADKFKGSLNYYELRASTLGKAIFKGDSKYADFSDESVQQRIAEAVIREARFKQLRQATAGGLREARDAALKMALLCGANSEDMTQVITEDSGKSYAISHNEAFKRVCKAENAGTLEMRVEGNTIKFITEDGISISFSQEGTWGGGQRRTRSQTKISSGSIKKLNVLDDKSTNESTLHKFLEGQMRLLGEILNQSKNDQAQL